MFSAFQDDENVIPVKIEIKKDISNIGNLYLVISMKKIKRTSVTGSPVGENSSSRNPDTDSIYRIQDIVANVNPSDERFNADNEDIRFSSREEVLSNQKSIMLKFGITNLDDYINVQKNVNNTLRAKGFFTNSDGKSRTDVNNETGMVIITNKSGIKETFNESNYSHNGKYLKPLKLLTIEKVPEAIKKGKVVGNNIGNYHYNKTANYAYIKCNVTVGQTPITLKLAIRQSKNVNKFWVHYIEIEKSTNGTTSADSITDAAAFNSIDAKSNTTTDSAESQEKFSLRSENPTDNLKGETVRVFKEDMGDIDFAGDTLKGLKESTGIKFVISEFIILL